MYLIKFPKNDVIARFLRIGTARVSVIVGLGRTGTCSFTVCAGYAGVRSIGVPALLLVVAIPQFLCTLIRYQ